jgi:tetratricopeptide (TPR) repeat protein
LSFSREKTPDNDSTKPPKEVAEQRAVILKNRAQVNLKMENYEACVKDCEEALVLVPGDSKTLFRRATALEKLERLDEAYKDAKAALQLDHDNKAIHTLLQGLYGEIQAKADFHARTSNKVTEIVRHSFV